MSAPAGWHPDPSGSGGQRYWDGTAWTEHTAPLQAPGGYGSGGIQQPALAEGVRVNTVWAWLIALLPLLSLLSFLVWNIRAYLEASLHAATDPGAATAALFTPGYALALLIALVVYAGSIVCAVLDHRALTGIGVVRPFHWAWQFLPPVYIIGRAVVLHRRVHRGTGPLWVFIAVYVIVFVVQAAIFGSAMASVFSTLDPTTLGTTG